MKKHHIFYAFLFFGIFGAAQSPCPPLADGVLRGDYPPGCTICSPLFEGSTAGYSPDTLKYDFPCGLVENSQWISMIADSSGVIQASVLAENCLLGQGVEYAIYDEDLNLVSDCKSSSGTNDPPPAVNANNLVPGNVYYLMIDGVDGDECDILVNQAGGSGLNYPRQPVRIAADPPSDRYCPGAEVCYSIDRMPGAYEYIWEGPVNLDSLSGGGLLDTFFCVRFNNTGGGILSVTPSFDCGMGVTSITPAIALPILPTNVNLIVCIDEMPIKFASREFSEFGTYQFTIPSRLGCDSLLNFTLSEATILPQIIDTILCAGTCVQIQDSCYWESTSGLDLHCLFIEELNITFIDSFPAPQIECIINNERRSFNWDKVTGAEEYLILINGDTFSTQTWTNFQILSVPADSQVTIRVLPLADDNCIFKAAELTCPESSFANETFSPEILSIFPNPTSGWLKIEASVEIETIQVFDFSGKEILQSKNQRIDLSGFETGVYFLKIQTEAGVILKKLFKE